MYDSKKESLHQPPIKEDLLQSRFLWVPFFPGKKGTPYPSTQQPLTSLLDLQAGGVVAVVGCGGKTALINRIARENAHRRVLVTPTTKIYPMQDAGVVPLHTVEEALAYRHPAPGLHCAGCFHAPTGKLRALPLQALGEMVPRYDLVLLEADGTRGLPLKGWGEHEPVVPGFCTHTVGVVAIQAYGKRATEQSVFRLEEFLRLTGLQEGNLVSLAAIADMVCMPGGMLHNAQGKRYLVVNQVEETAQAQHAAQLAAMVAQRAGVKRIVLGSAQAGCFMEWVEEQI